MANPDIRALGGGLCNNIGLQPWRVNSFHSGPSVLPPALSYQSFRQDFVRVFVYGYFRLAHALARELAKCLSTFSKSRMGRERLYGSLLDHKCRKLPKRFSYDYV